MPPAEPKAYDRTECEALSCQEKNGQGARSAGWSGLGHESHLGLRKRVSESHEPLQMHVVELLPVNRHELGDGLIELVVVAGALALFHDVLQVVAEDLEDPSGVLLRDIAQHHDHEQALALAHEAVGHDEEPVDGTSAHELLALADGHLEVAVDQGTDVVLELAPEVLGRDLRRLIDDAVLSMRLLLHLLCSPTKS